MLKTAIAAWHSRNAHCEDVGALPRIPQITDVWLVERILGERTTKHGRKEFKEAHVKWLDYTEPTWEPLSNVFKTDAWKKWAKLRAKRKGGG